MKSLAANDCFHEVSRAVHKWKRRETRFVWEIPMFERYMGKDKLTVVCEPFRGHSSPQLQWEMRVCPTGNDDFKFAPGFMHVQTRCSPPSDGESSVLRDVHFAITIKNRDCTRNFEETIPKLIKGEWIGGMFFPSSITKTFVNESSGSLFIHCRIEFDSPNFAESAKFDPTISNVIEEVRLGGPASISGIIDAIGKLYHTKRFADLTIGVRGKRRFLVNKAILLARFDRCSEVIHQTPAGDRIDLDESRDVVGALLHFVFTTKCDIKAEYSKQLIGLARRFSVNGLVRLCERQLVSKLSVQNFPEMFQIALICGLDDLKVECRRYFHDHSTEIVNWPNSPPFLTDESVDEKEIIALLDAMYLDPPIVVERADALPPRAVRHEWTIEHFDEHCKSGECFESASFGRFTLGDHSEFILRVYPKGFNAESSGFVSVFGEFHAISETFVLRVAFLDPSGSVACAKDFSVSANDDHSSVIGTATFCSTEEAAASLGDDGALLVICELHFPDASDEETSDEKEFVEAMKRLRKMEENADFTVLAGGKEIFVHRAIVAARCEKMLVDESQVKREISGVSHEASVAFFDFVYTGTCLVRREFLLDLVKLSKEYHLDDLRDDCERRLCDALSVENVLEMYSHASMFELAELKQRAVELFVLNMEEICTREEWDEFADADEALAMELLASRMPFALLPKRAPLSV